MFLLVGSEHTCDCAALERCAPQSTELCGHTEQVLCSRLKIIDCIVIRGISAGYEMRFPINIQNVGPLFVHLSVPGEC